MSTNIEVQRICKHCGNEFIAKTTRTRYCSHTCNSRAYKAEVKKGKIEVSNTETRSIVNRPIAEVQAKEFLTVRDVARLLNLSVRTTYRVIEQGNIKAVNLSQRKMLIKRSDIDKLFS